MRDSLTHPHYLWPKVSLHIIGKFFRKEIQSLDAFFCINEVTRPPCQSHNSSPQLRTAFFSAAGGTCHIDDTCDTSGATPSCVSPCGMAQSSTVVHNWDHDPGRPVDPGDPGDGDPDARAWLKAILSRNDLLQHHFFLNSKEACTYSHIHDHKAHTYL